MQPLICVRCPDCTGQGHRDVTALITRHYPCGTCKGTGVVHLAPEQLPGQSLLTDADVERIARRVSELMRDDEPAAALAIAGIDRYSPRNP